MLTSDEISLKTSPIEFGHGPTASHLGDNLGELIDAAMIRVQKLQEDRLRELGITGIVGKFNRAG